MLSLFTSAASMLGGGESGLGQAGDLLGGGGESSSATAQAGDFIGGSLNVTKEDVTIKYALIIGGVILAIAIIKKVSKK